MSASGRFAPSPTGPLHLGSLRTALAAWLFARSQSSAFFLRIEDLDQQRSKPAFESAQIADLGGLGLDWDGPVLHQSRRFHIYEQAIERLEAAGHLYPCFCTRAEIRDAASAPHHDLPEGAYPGTCRRLSAAQRRRRLGAGLPHALRVDAGAAPIEFSDRLLGACSGRVDDFVIRRADGVPAYQLAVVVDDVAQGVEEVVRGADLARSTPRQIFLARLLDLPLPRYAHVPLVLGPDGARLAKRHGAVTMAERDQSSELLLGWLAHSLGQAEDRDRVAAASDLLEDFDPDRIPKDPVVLPSPTSSCGAWAGGQ